MATGPTDGMCGLARMMGWSQKDGRNAVLLFYKKTLIFFYSSNIFDP